METQTQKSEWNGALRQGRTLVLASASPRRRELLSGMGLRFVVDPADTPEAVDSTLAHPTLPLAREKARAIAPRHPGAVILAADTLVLLEGEALGKPGDAGEAAHMLARLSGRWHEVETGLYLLDAETGREAQHAERTRVRFARLSGAEIAWYVGTGEPMDKAGAYALQGRAGMFIDRIEGSFQNVIGLPTSSLRTLLRQFSIG